MCCWWEHEVGANKMIGLHLSGDGYKVLCTEMKRVIAREYPKLVPERIPFAL